MALFEKKKKAQVDPAPVTKATLTRSIVSSAFILTILSVAVTAYITTAWFSMNKKVDNTGVHMNIESGPNMFIANGDSSGDNYSVYSAYTAQTSHMTISFSDASVNLVPTTHSSHVTVDSSCDNTSGYGLKYLTNPSAIDRASGVLSSTASAARTDIVLAEVDGNTSPLYFVDHKVLIGSTDKPLPIASGEALMATLSSTAALPVEPGDNVDETTSHHLYRYAASVDFYVNVVNATTFSGADGGLATNLPLGVYKGTLNLAGKDYATWNIDSTTAGADANYVNLLSGGTGVNIPLNTAATTNNCCIIVTMRFYFDGALLKKQDLDNDGTDTSKAYVHSAFLDTSGMPSLNVHFEVDTIPSP